MKKTLLLILFVLTNISLFAQNPADVDLSYNPGSGFDNAINDVTIQSDGKILVSGSFSSYNGISQNKLIRLNPDGSKDTNFDIGTGFNGTWAMSTVIQSDGKILVGGYFTTYNGISQNRLIRLNTDGSKDTSFDIGTGFDADVSWVAIQPDGKILVGGYFTTYNGISQNRFIRLNSDGSKDTSFNIGTGFNNMVSTFTIQSDGRILVGGVFTTFNGGLCNRFISLNADGTKESNTTFYTGGGFDNSGVSSIKTQSDGKILISGGFTSWQGLSQNKLIRMNTDGSKDYTFDVGTGFNTTVNDTSIQPDGKIWAVGGFTTLNGTTQNRIVQLNTDGSKDTSANIGTGFGGQAVRITFQSDGKFLVSGVFTTFNGIPQYKLIRLNADGSKDTSFNTSSGFNSYVKSIKIQSDDKILVGGYFTVFNHQPESRLVRLNPDKSKDNTFNIGTGFNNIVETIAIQSNGKILVGGVFTAFNGVSENKLIRLNTDGSKDTSFNLGTGFNSSAIAVKTIVVQSDGKILVGGTFSTFNGISQNKLIRLNPDGSKDTSFDIGTGSGISVVYCLAIQSDGKILVGGTFSTFNGISQNKLIRLNTDGSKDYSFDIGTGFDFYTYSITMQSDGKILVGGDFSAFNGISQEKLIRLNSDGSKDTSFNIGSGFDEAIYSIKMQSDGKILVGGFFTVYNGISQKGLIRLNSDGSKDMSFDIGTGFDTGVFSIAIQSNDKILVVGGFNSYRAGGANSFIVLKGNSVLSNEEFSKTKISLYPNPTKDILNISLAENISIENYEIYDLIGKNVISKTTTENFVNVSELSNGIYILKVTSSEGIMTNKFIKE